MAVFNFGYQDVSLGVVVSAGLLLAAVLLGLLIRHVLFWVLERLSRQTGTPWDDRAVAYARKPSRVLFPLLVINLVSPSLALPVQLLGVLNHLTKLLFIAAVAYLLIRLVFLLRDLLLARHDLTASDNLTARKIHTQIKVLEKVLISIVTVATAAFMLMTFDGIRQIGVSILASAGIAGIIIGLAAQKSISTLLAGVQIALTQPIRVEDVVIVEGEWGRVEDITLTYVVIRIWDLRRLIVPISYFIEKPFQNWTRSSCEILGTVFLYVDYTIPVDEVRRELQRIVEQSALWDRKVCGLQVTDCKPSVLELRLLVSASDASKAWDLRCHLREAMVSFVQRKYPGCLPRVRAEVGEGRALGGSAGALPAGGQ
jgi:small-conductance mechanosensitive channel